MIDLNNTYDDKWKEELRTYLISGMLEDQPNKDEINARVGFYYLNYAPKYLYKYFGDNPERLKMIKNNTMWFSAPSKFNDVFDCDVTIDDKKLLNSFFNLFTNKHHIRRGSPAWIQMSNELKKSIKNLRDLFENMRKENGIACFSEEDDSILMWAHYANNHKGMCVEYELLEISKQLSFSPVPVIYDDNRVILESINLDTVDNDSLDLFVKSLTSKSPEWSYEKEWRIIQDDGVCGDIWDEKNSGALLKMITPSSIILGCMVESEFENPVYSYCEKNKVNLYKMNKDPALYKLVKTPILEFDE